MSDMPAFAAPFAQPAGSPIRELFPYLSQPGMISLAGGYPSPSLFDAEGLAHAAAQAMTGDAQTLQYGATEGLPILRTSLAALMRERGIQSGAEQVMVTTGSQQAFDLLVRVLIEPGDTVLVEVPAYPATLQALRLAQAHIVPVPMDEHGLQADALAELLQQLPDTQRPKLLYTVPNFSNPRGTLLAAERREALVQLACTHGFWVVEDDPYGELRFDTDGPMPPTLRTIGADVWRTQVRFIGAGVIAVAAVWTLGTLIGPVVQGVKRSFGSLRPQGDARQRTEQDMAPRWILLVTLAMVVVLVITFAAFLAPTMLSPGSRWTLIACAVVFAVVFGFLVAAACGYMAGLIGSSSSPISGIGMIAITLVSLLLLAVGADNGIVGSPEASKLGIALAIFTTSAVVAVATISNDNLQDLKTGWLVGATPWRQQVALLVGCVAGAAVISPVLELLYNAYGFPGALPRAGMDAAQALSAPQATLMTAIATGIFTHKLEWNMVITGTIVGAILIAIDWVLKRRGGAARLPVLAVGIGIYLPPTVSAPLVIGAVLAWVIEKILARRAQAAGVPYERYAEVPNRHGVLLASGLIVGESLVGVLMAAIIGTTGTDAPLAIVGASFESAAQWLGLIVFALICWAFARRVLAVRPAH